MSLKILYQAGIETARQAATMTKLSERGNVFKMKAGEPKKQIYHETYRMFFRNSRFLISDMHVQNNKYENFVSVSSLIGECAAQKLKNLQS